MINRERMELWIQALEQDRFRKCTSHLRIAGYNESGETVYHCALGVGIQVALENGLFKDHPMYSKPETWELVFDSGDGYLPECVMQWYGLEDSDPEIRAEPDQSPISYLNDLDFPFWDIAQLMRATYLKDDVS